MAPTRAGHRSRQRRNAHSASSAPIAPTAHAATKNQTTFSATGIRSRIRSRSAGTGSKTGTYERHRQFLAGGRGTSVRPCGLRVGTPCGPKPSQLTHSGRRAGRTVDSCYLTASRGTPNTPNGTRTPTIHMQLYTCVPSFSDAEHGSRFLQGFYLYVSPVARLHITPEQEARNGQISGWLASRPFGRPLLVNTWPCWASALVH